MKYLDHNQYMQLANDTADRMGNNSQAAVIAQVFFYLALALLRLLELCFNAWCRKNHFNDKTNHILY